MNRFLGFVKKEFLHIFRDYRTLFILFGIPAAQILIFGFAVSMDIKNAGIAFLDLSHDEITRELTDKIISSGFFRKTETLLNYSDIDKVFKKGKTKAVIIFEKNFGKNLVNEGKASLSIIADGSEPNTATLVTNYTTAIVNDFNLKFAGGALSHSVRIQPSVKMLYNPNLKSHFMFVPGVITLILILICALMTSVTITQGKGVRNNGGPACLTPPARPDNPGQSDALFYSFVYKCTADSGIIMVCFRAARKGKHDPASCREHALYPHEPYPRNTYINCIKHHATGNIYLTDRTDAANYFPLRIYLPD